MLIATIGFLIVLNPNILLLNGIHPSANPNHFQGHPQAITHQSHFASRDITPINRKLDRVKTEFLKQQAQFDIKRKAWRLHIGCDLSESFTPQELEAALGIVSRGFSEI